MKVPKVQISPESVDLHVILLNFLSVKKKHVGDNKTLNEKRNNR